MFIGDVEVNVLLVGYFLSLFAGLAWILHRSWSHAFVPLHTRVAYALFGLGSLAVAWYHIGAFIIDDFGERHSGDVALHPKDNRFVRAYKEVSEHPLQWFWSSSLLSLVPSLIAFYVLESSRRGVRDAFVYVWVGFFGAISGSFPMLLLRFKGGRSESSTVGLVRTPALNFVTAASCIAGLLSVAITPFTLSNNQYFMINLAFMHLILLVPLMNRSSSRGVFRSPAWAVFFSISATVAAAIRIQSISSISALVSFSAEGLQTLGKAVWANSCQRSITGDLIFYLCSGDHRDLFGKTKHLLIVALCVVLLPWLGSAVVFPAFLAARELEMVSKAISSVAIKQD